jgi:glycerol uptake facilitator protein
LLGTAILILLGDGVVSGVLLNKSKANGAGWVAITTGWAFAVMSGAFVAAAAGSPQADLNPAVTLAKMIMGGTNLPDGLVRMAGEMIGAMLGATLAFLAYHQHWGETDDPGLKLACFCTGPAIRHSFWNLATEIIATFVLVFVIFCIFAKTGATGGNPAPGFGTYLVAMLIWGIGLSLGGPTGYALNPARDLGPRIAHALLPIAGKGDSDWGYAWIPVVGPCIGAGLAALLARSLAM